MRGVERHITTMDLLRRKEEALELQLALQDYVLGKGFIDVRSSKAMEAANDMINADISDIDRQIGEIIDEAIRGEIA